MENPRKWVFSTIQGKTIRKPKKIRDQTRMVRLLKS